MTERINQLIANLQPQAKIITQVGGFLLVPPKLLKAIPCCLWSQYDSVPTNLRLQATKNHEQKYSLPRCETPPPREEEIRVFVLQIAVGRQVGRGDHALAILLSLCVQIRNALLRYSH